MVARPDELEPLLDPIVTTDAVRRFAVQFFAFWTGPTSSVRLNPAELTAYRWLSPADALQRASAGTLGVPPATQAALAALNHRVGAGDARIRRPSRDESEGPVA